MSLLSEYMKSLKRLEVEELADLYLYRPLAFLLVKGIYRTNITPNQITLVSLVVGLMAGICYGIGHRSTVILGAILYGLSMVLDCADGQLARLKKNGTRLGRILDGLIDYLVSIAVYLGLGFGLASASGHPLTWWLILAAAGASHIFHSLSIDYYRVRFLDHIEGPSTSAEEEDGRTFQVELDGLNAQKGRVLHKAAIRLYLRYLKLQKKMTNRAAATGRGKQGGGDDYYAKNKAAMRGWTFLGSSTGGTLLIVSALLGRFDFYFWGLIVAGNLWAAIMYIIQHRIDHRLSKETAP